MLKVLNWLTKAPFYRLLIIAVILFVVIAQAEGKAYWIGGFATVLYLFFIGYAKWFKTE